MSQREEFLENKVDELRKQVDEVRAGSGVEMGGKAARSSLHVA